MSKMKFLALFPVFGTGHALPSFFPPNGPRTGSEDREKCQTKSRTWREYNESEEVTEMSKTKGGNRENIKEDATELPGYTYPDCVMTPMRIAPTARYMALKIPDADASFARALDSQRDSGKAVYGACFLLSENAAAEKAAAEKAAAEMRSRHVWKLSEREKKLVKSLGKE